MNRIVDMIVRIYDRLKFLETTLYLHQIWIFRGCRDKFNHQFARMCIKGFVISKIFWFTISIKPFSWFRMILAITSLGRTLYLRNNCCFQVFLDLHLLVVTFSFESNGRLKLFPEDFSAFGISSSADEESLKEKSLAFNHKNQRGNWSSSYNFFTYSSKFVSLGWINFRGFEQYDILSSILNKRVFRPEC